MHFVECLQASRAEAPRPATGAGDGLPPWDDAKCCSTPGIRHVCGPLCATEAARALIDDRHRLLCQYFDGGPAGGFAAKGDGRADGVGSPRARRPRSMATGSAADGARRGGAGPDDDVLLLYSRTAGGRVFFAVPDIKRLLHDKDPKGNPRNSFCAAPQSARKPTL
ncbi:hypothetical protein M885DRAFT_23263 [Pelagophyceae sp. CCMP2097]|nr:hypothetical protein M885DRAFT_23263 [Pelagophyceae sp. CCMP2097]